MGVGRGELSNGMGELTALEKYCAELVGLFPITSQAEQHKIQIHRKTFAIGLN